MADSALDVALPEDAAVQKSQGEPGSADGSSDLAFAARMFESEPPQAASNANPSAASGGALSKAAQQARASKADSDTSDDASPSDSTAPSGPEASTDDSRLAVVATKGPVLIAEDRRNPTAHSTQQEAVNAPGAAPQGGVERETPSNSSAQTHETAAPRPVEPEPPPTPPVSHDVALRLADGPNNVDIRMSERGGEIRVMVHTPDGNLANSMRNELPDLVGKLRQSGYQAETWRPATSHQTDGERQRGADSSPQQQHSGGRRESRQQQQQQQQQNQPRWVGEWNMSFGPAKESSK